MNFKKNNKKRIIGTALALGICASNCMFSTQFLYAKESDDGVIDLPFVSLSDIENDQKKTEEAEKGIVQDDNETMLVTDDGTIVLPFIPYKDNEELITGDINKDGVVSAADMMSLKMMILKVSEPDSKADLNEDGEVNVMDLVKLVNIILE